MVKGELLRRPAQEEVDGCKASLTFNCHFVCVGQDWFIATSRRCDLVDVTLENFEKRSVE